MTWKKQNDRGRQTDLSVFHSLKDDRDPQDEIPSCHPEGESRIQVGRGKNTILTGWRRGLHGNTVLFFDIMLFMGGNAPWEHM